MKYILFSIVILITFNGCRDNHKDNLNKTKNPPREQTLERELEKSKDSQNIRYGKLNPVLVDLIKKYSIEFPLEKIEVKPENVHQSYYVSFLRIKKDTILLLCRQPFLMEIFPDFAFSESPKEKPKYKGMVADSDLPIFIFDSESLGEYFYRSAILNEEFPEKYETDEGKYHTPSVPPIFKYRVHQNRFEFVEKSKNQWID